LTGPPGLGKGGSAFAETEGSNKKKIKAIERYEYFAINDRVIGLSNVLIIL
jgi:hypothetical protein